MKYDPILHSGIRASHKAMHKMLITALKETGEACDYIDDGEQNTAIGTILTLDERLEQSITLYKGSLPCTAANSGGPL
jgi:hypothetical protein